MKRKPIKPPRKAATKTQLAHIKFYDGMAALRDEYMATIRAEFTVGTRVEYMHGLKSIQGRVVHMDDYPWDDLVSFKNEKTGKIWRMEAHKLSILSDQ